jgi:propanol-preferring alcohol dehydrogenase
MRALLFDRPGSPLRFAEIPPPERGAGDLLLEVLACGICRTDLHLLDGEIPAGRSPLVLGHQVVARVLETPAGSRLRPGDRVGVPWLGSTCGACRSCLEGRENLCAEARFTGCHRDGGLAELAVADERFCFPIPGGLAAESAAPLLCAGLIGNRALRMAGPPEETRRLGLYGFGAAAHIVAQVARWRGQELFGFVRRGNAAGEEFARSLGCCWAGPSDEPPPEPLDAAILFAPAGELVPAALRAVRPGGSVVCAGIHMSDIPSFPYSILWGERSLRSVANLTRRDGEELLALAVKIPIRTEVRVYSLEEAPMALDDLRAGRFNGAAVVRIAKEDRK